MSSCAPCTAAELRAALASSQPPAVIDVLTEDSFAAEHVSGAENFCVYETAFLGKITARFPDLATPLVLCGASSATIEAETAFAKLTAAGYSRVSVLSGGLAAWKDGGGACVTGACERPAPDSGTFQIDPATSVIFWTGRNLFNHHTGTLRCAGGTLELRDGAFVSGAVELDMESLACTDLTDPAMNAMLVHHLRDEDFFAVARFPRATFVFEKITPRPDVRAGLPNFDITGALTLRGVTQPVSFPATIARRDDGTYGAQAFLAIDRTRWGVLYGSSGFFARLAGHLVADEVQLHLKIFTALPAR